MEEFKDSLSQFCERTATEETCHWYDFTICDDVIHCREGYEGAEGLLEIHGPATELDKLREPLAHLNADYFEIHSGIGKPSSLSEK